MTIVECVAFGGLFLLLDWIFIRWRVWQMRGMFYAIHYSDAIAMIAADIGDDYEKTRNIFHNCMLCMQNEQPTERDFTVNMERILQVLSPDIALLIRKNSEIPRLLSFQDWIWVNKVALRLGDWIAVRDTAQSSILMFMVEFDKYQKTLS